MKIVKFIVVLMVILVGLGIGVYYVGTNMASEKLMDAVSTELENSGEIEAIRQSIENDPELQAFLEGAENVDESKLPFTTKEEATRLLINKVGLTELKDIQSQVQNGTASKEEILRNIEAKLTNEEILALKVIAYKELNKQGG
ncbi:hypothetical protein [Bacillus sp. T33-2]|uniref:hypothetical protein n=1 Tax=Bacillus sp. T33-2 TaxID=2054168 RepID=UPI000C76FFBE|nr:hypothetical protein [Bacillus sp. T33-2]PLR95965.1 hypothetical protein CVD19_13180 [Bacillus sp. T33-2]